MNNSIVQELIKEADYFGDNSDERLYIDLRQSNGYTKELDKPKRLQLRLRNLSKKKEAKSLGIHKWRVYLFAKRRFTNFKIQDK